MNGGGEGARAGRHLRGGRDQPKVERTREGPVRPYVGRTPPTHLSPGQVKAPFAYSWELEGLKIKDSTRT